MDTENEKRSLKQRLDEITEDLSSLQSSSVASYETTLNLVTDSIHSEIKMLERLIVEEDEAFKQDATRKASAFQREKEMLLALLAQSPEQLTTSVVQELEKIQEPELELEPEPRTKKTKTSNSKLPGTSPQREQRDKIISPRPQLSQTSQLKSSHTAEPSRVQGVEDSVISTYPRPTGGVFAGGHTGYKPRSPKKKPASARSLVSTSSDDPAFTFNASELLAKQLSDARERRGAEDMKPPIKSAFASKRAFGKK